VMAGNDFETVNRLDQRRTLESTQCQYKYGETNQLFP
jgi:hypothetical protein